MRVGRYGMRDECLDKWMENNHRQGFYSKISTNNLRDMAEQKKFRDIVWEMTPKDIVVANVTDEDRKAFDSGELFFSE